MTVRGVVQSDCALEAHLTRFEILGYPFHRDPSAPEALRDHTRGIGEAGLPKEYSARGRAALNCPSGTMHVVEVQKTRSGQKNGERTRPYRFGDFDILAVNLHPSTGDWKRFIYTVGSWLLPRPQEQGLIEIFQPVPTCPDEYWTDDLARCIEWFLAGQRKRLYS